MTYSTLYKHITYNILHKQCNTNIVLKCERRDSNLRLPRETENAKFQPTIIMKEENLFIHSSQLLINQYSQAAHQTH